MMLSRPFVALFVSVFVATMGISMVSPLLPVYAKDLGASGVWLGLTFSIFAVVQAVVGPFAGRLSDRYGTRAVFWYRRVAIMCSLSSMVTPST